MPQPNYQEPIEKEDLDPKKNYIVEQKVTGAEIKKSEETAQKEKQEAGTAEKPPKTEGEPVKESKEVQISEKIETARKAIQTQKPAVAASVQDDAKTVAGIADYEKKVEKLIQIALEKGPVHAIRVAQHIDKNDNYTLDEIHDRMLEDGLRKQLIEKGLLREL